jgi:hypothetical protein
MLPANTRIQQYQFTQEQQVRNNTLKIRGKSYLLKFARIPLFFTSFNIPNQRLNISVATPSLCKIASANEGL